MKINREIISATYTISDLTQDEFNTLFDAIKEAKSGFIWQGCHRNQFNYRKEEIMKIDDLLSKLKIQ